MISLAFPAGGARPAATGVPRVAMGIIGVAWAVSLFASASGGAAAHRHQAFMDAGQPLLAVTLFLGSWLVMVAAMMLPASAPAIRELAAIPTATQRPLARFGQFLLAYAMVWAALGLLGFSLQHLGEAAPWLANRPWLLAGFAFGVAGAFELSPIKRRWLQVCRDPGNHLAAHGSAARFGTAHALACVGSSGALMLVMVAAGLANPLWMAVLTAVMAYQAVGARGIQTVPVVGGALLALAGLTLLTAGLPA